MSTRIVIFATLLRYRTCSTITNALADLLAIQSASTGAIDGDNIIYANGV